MSRTRYEVQVRLSSGWANAGNWPARTLKEATASLELCAEGFRGEGSIYDHRLVRLSHTKVAFRKARRKKSL
jgi:hypothetical protein